MPWHVSVQRCLAHGCRLKHVELAQILPHAQSADRNKLRKLARSGTILGTNKVPTLDEQREGKGKGSARDGWWWHEGDPHVDVARRVLR